MIIKRSEKICNSLKGLMHPTRLAILCALRKGPLSVNQLLDRVGQVSQSNLSQHLSQMKYSGLVSGVRMGTRIDYQVCDPKIFELLDLIKACFCK